MADYSGPFPEKDVIRSAPEINMTVEGYRRADLLPGYTWVIDDLGQQSIDGPVISTNPIESRNRIRADFFRRVDHLLSLLNFIGGDFLQGWRAAVEGFLIPGSALNNFVTGVDYEIVSVSGQWLTLLVGERPDPQHTIIWFAQGREHIEDALTKVDRFGMWCQPNDMVSIGGNSVLRGKITARIIDIDFSTLTYAAALSTDTFRIKLNKTCSYAMTPYDPDSDTVPIAEVRREAWRMEDWTRIDDLYPLFVTRQQDVFAIEDIDPSGLIPLLDGDGNETGMAPPIADRDMKRGFVGTFRAEVDYGDGWVDVTSSMRRGSAGTWQWHRLAIEPGSTGPWKTTLYMGATDFFGADAENLLDGATQVRITWGRPTAGNSNTVAGAHAPVMRHCAQCIPDYTNTVGNTNTNGVGIDGDGRHWYCGLRDNVALTTPTNLERFVPGDCRQVTSCMGFAIAQPPRVTEDWWGCLWGAWNSIQKQLTPGYPETEMERCRRPSVGWLLNVPAQYVAIAQYFGLVTPCCGGFGKKVGIFTDGDGNESIQFLRGAIWNPDANLDTAFDWGSSQTVNEEALGVLPRLLGDAAAAQGTDGELDDDLDPGGVIRANTVMLRAPAPIYKDCEWNGNSLQYGAREAPGVEGENRLARFNRATEAWLRNIKPAQGGAQGMFGPGVASRGHTIEFFAANRTVGTHDDIRGVIRIVPFGRADHGRRRIGNPGLNGSVLQAESIAGGMRIHCAPGPTVVSKTINAGEDSYDDTRIIFTGGNVGNLPDPLKPNKSRYGGVNDRVNGINRAREGDTIQFFGHPDLEGISFKLKRVVPCAGIDFSSFTGTRFQVGGTVGPYFNPTGYDGTQELVITNLRIKFLDGSWQPWYGEDAPAVREILPADRDRTEQDTDLAEIVLQWMHAPATAIYTSAVDAGFGSGSSIVDLSAHVPAWTAQQWVGCYATIVGSGVFWPITASSSSGLTLALGATPPTGPFQFAIYLRPGTQASGDGRAYASYALFYWAWATETGLLEANRRFSVEWSLDGVDQTAQEIMIDPPSLLLANAPDIGRVTEWSVIVQDPVGSPGSPSVTLAYEGILVGGESSLYNLSDGPSFNGWKWHADTSRVVLHPNRAGFRVDVNYEAVIGFSLGTRPDVGYVGLADVTDQDFYWLCDIGDIEDEDGRLAAVGADGLAGLGFYISTGCVLLKDALAVEARVSEGPGIWNPVADVVPYYADGEIWLQEAAVTAMQGLAETIDVRTTGAKIANHSAETSAAMPQRVIEALELIDEVLTGFPAISIEPFGIRGNGVVAIVGDDYDTFELAGKLGVFNADVLLAGIPTWDGTGFVSQPNGDSGKLPEHYIDNFYWETDDGGLFTEDYVIGASCGFVAPQYVGAQIKGTIVITEIARFFTALPEGTQIIEAEAEISVPVGAAIWKSDLHVGPDSYTNVSEPNSDVSFLLLGQGNDGNWNTIGVVSGVGEIEAGKTKVIGFKAAVELLMSFTDSPWRKFGYLVMPGPSVDVGGGSFNINESASSQAGIIQGLLQGCASYSPEPEADSDELTTFQANCLFPLHNARTHFGVSARQYRGSAPPSIVQIRVQFQLPDGTIESERLGYGNWPSMLPR